MPKITRSQALIAALAVTVICAIVFFFTQPGEKRPPPSVGGYYAGPMKGKGAKVTYGDDNGHEVAPPVSSPALTSRSTTSTKKNTGPSE
jgi:hypothetical protein